MKQNSSLLVGIIADDLTSATDGAAAFLAKGYAPLITRKIDHLEDEAVASIDTNSRAFVVSEATKATAEAVSALSNARLLFKTIDSTLRGHIREEIAAAFLASGRSKLVVAPAFPEAGRLTVDGIQVVNGTPVGQSAYGRDPVHPASTSYIADLIDASLGTPIILAANSSGDAATTASILILDADSQDVLNRQVASIPDPETVLWVGSPGLAIALASLVPAAPDELPLTGGAAGRVVIVAGSANPVTHAQCDALQAQGVAMVSDLADAPSDARVVCLRAPLARQKNASAVVANLTEQAATVVARHDYDVVIATGGETMAAILDRLGISRFILTRELEPGFPVGRAERADGSSLTIAMKAGGFGSPSTLLDAARDLRAKPSFQKDLSMTTHDAPLAVTMGDPSGIGPEIIAKMYLRRPDKRHWIVVGDALVMTHALGALNADVLVRPIGSVNEAVFEDGTLNVLCSSQFSVLPPVSQVSAISGRAAFDAIALAIRLAREGRVGGIVTAPIHKEALAAAGLPYPGHTEILADHGGAAKVAMMLANEDIRTVLVTIHCSLAEAIQRGDFAAQMDAIRLAHAGAQALGIANPRVAVAGLNPHAGEGGLFGDEEIHIIGPAIEAARAEGIDVSGPWPGDTVFMQARKGRFDIVVAQYHDQGLIPVKYMGLDQGVNVTLGLPFVRTSPDHGTAFDIAGTGIADPSSIETAFDYALRLKASRPNQKADTP